MIMRQEDIDKVRASVGRQLGSKVLIKLNRGRHKIDVAEGVIKEAYPSIFVIEVEGETIEEPSKMLSFSYTDVLTKDVRMKLC